VQSYKAKLCFYEYQSLKLKSCICTGEKINKTIVQIDTSDIRIMVTNEVSVVVVVT